MSKSENEKWYDQTVHRVLKRVGKKCVARGIPFIAVVEYDKGETELTTCVKKGDSMEMVILNLCAKSRGNIDAFVLGLMRYARENNIDYSRSVIMRLLEDKNV